jgi:hypothetical protein
MAKLVMLFFVSISQYPATLLGAAATVVLPFDTLLTRSAPGQVKHSIKG